MPLTVEQSPSPATRGKQVTLAAKIDGAAPTVHIQWSPLAGSAGVTSGSNDATYIVEKAETEAKYRVTAGNESIDYDLKLEAEVDVEMEPMFSPDQLGLAAGMLSFLLVVISTWAFARVDDITLGMGAGFHLGVTMSLLLFVVGVIAILASAWLLVADLRKPKVAAPINTTGPAVEGAASRNVIAEVLAAVIEKFGTGLKDLKASVAMGLFGVVLLLTSGFIAYQSMPSTDSCSYILVLGSDSTAVRIEIPEGQPPPLSINDTSIRAEPCMTSTTTVLPTTTGSPTTTN